MYEPAKFVILGSLWEVAFFALDFKYFSTRKWELSFSNRYWSTVCWSMSFSRIGYPGISIIFHYKSYWYVFISYYFWLSTPNHLFVSNYLVVCLFSSWLFIYFILFFLIMQLAFTMVVFPCLLLAYTGQASYIISHKNHVADAFYRSIPGFCSLFFYLPYFSFIR